MARRSQKDKDEWLGSIVERELSKAENSGDRGEKMRREAVRYYTCAPRGDEVEDRSAAISPDVRDMTNAALAMLGPMLGADAVVEFEPLGVEDEEQAKAESSALNTLFMEDNRGSVLLQSALKDAMLMRNGAFKVWIERKVSKDRVSTKAMSEEERTAWLVQELAADSGLQVQLGADSVTLIRTRERLRISAVPIENCSWSSGDGPLLQEKRFFAEALDLTRSDLLERGIPKSKVEGLGTRSRRTSEGPRAKASDDQDGETEDQELIGCHECYLRIDLDGDGISERWRLLVADENKVLERERMALIPYAVGTAFINPHRLEGESLFEHLQQVQDNKTALLRDGLDGSRLNVNGRVIYNPAVASEEDILNPVVGGGIRSRDVSQVVPLVLPETSTGVLAQLAYQDKMRTEGGGASLDMMQADTQIVGETATGIERQYGAKELMVQFMCGTLAETLIRDFYTMLHQFTRAYWARPIMVRMAGQYVATDPRQWPERTRLNLTIGQTPGQRAHQQMMLTQYVQAQAQGIASGLDGVLFDMGTMHRAFVRLLQLAGVSNPETMIIDPASPDAQAVAKGKADAAERAAAEQSAIVQRQLAIEEQKVANDRAKAEGDLAHKYFETEIEMAMKEAELVAGAEVDLEKQRRDAVARQAQARAAVEKTPVANA